MNPDDRQFVNALESCTLAPELFDHRGHLRLAWLYLSEYSLEQAIARVCRSINAYASSLGATDKFHHTLTEAMTRIIHARMARTEAEDFDAFVQANNDLLTQAACVLGQHYSKAGLNNAPARRRFVAPDLAPLPGLPHIEAGAAS